MRKSVQITGLACAAALVLGIFANTAFAADRPNVVLVITDDQGYGDIGAHGNEMIVTPNLDRMHSESLRLTDFHVDPTCAPTRSALMTGRYSTRAGVWHTIMGRSQLRASEITLADVFGANGYKTGMFGKWHLGDNYPFHPQNHGFQEAFYHGGGGVCQEADYWDNDYFDDTYYRNGTPEKTEGYCTDVWFSNAIDFIKSHKDEPFFCYLSTNAPHSPLNVDPKYSDPYEAKGVPSGMAKFYGMITNIDENMGVLRETLDELELADNTILIFMTDNGSAGGGGRAPGKAGFDASGKKWLGYNAGMRAGKGSHYDGGHRVPLFMHWPNGGLDKGMDLDTLTAHVDVLPTMIELCGIKPLEKMNKLDGMSIVPQINFSKAMANGQPCNVLWPDRKMFAEVNRQDLPPKGRNCVVMTERWRLNNMNELYDIIADPSQANNVIEQHPEVAAELTAAYEKRWPDVTSQCDEYSLAIVGSDQENPTTIYSHDWHPTFGGVPWNHNQVRSMMKANGIWGIEVAQDGNYRFTLRHRPGYCEFPLVAKTARFALADNNTMADPLFDESQDVTEGMTGAPFEVELKVGPVFMQSWLLEANGTERGAYFIDVERID